MSEIESLRADLAHGDCAMCGVMRVANAHYRKAKTRYIVTSNWTSVASCGRHLATTITWISQPGAEVRIKRTDE